MLPIAKLMFGIGKPWKERVGATTFDRCQNSLKPKGVFLSCIMGLTDMTWLGSFGPPSPGVRK
jgi:hypothetical protein